jgi:hypothetical protein
MERKGLIDLPMVIKVAMSKSGYGCKGALYNASLWEVFEEISKNISEAMYIKEDDVDEYFLPSHKKQIEVLIKIINCELDEKFQKFNEIY